MQISVSVKMSDLQIREKRPGQLICITNGLYIFGSVIYEGHI